MLMSCVRAMARHVQGAYSVAEGLMKLKTCLLHDVLGSNIKD